MRVISITVGLLRIAFAVAVGGACLGVLCHDPAIDATSNWIQLPLPHAFNVAFAFLLMVFVSLLAAGIAKTQMIWAVGISMVLIEWGHLRTNVFYNFSEVVEPLLAMLIAIALLPALQVDTDTESQLEHFHRDNETHRSIAALFARLFLGSIFIAQGLTNLLRHGGILGFAQKVYVLPFQGRLPTALLWFAGASNPPWEFVGGVLILTGFFTSQACLGMCLFLTIIIFGHVVQDGVAAIAGMRDYALANLLATLAVLSLSRQSDKWCIDSFWLHRSNRKKSNKENPAQAKPNLPLRDVR